LVYSDFPGQIKPKVLEEINWFLIRNSKATGTTMSAIDSDTQVTRFRAIAEIAAAIIKMAGRNLESITETHHTHSPGR
jgi:hypothetical protein